MIRDFERADADAVSTILHEEELPHPVTAAGVFHWHVAQPERAHARSWIAFDERKRLVGWGRARLRWSTSAEGVADLWVYIAPSARGRGLGAALYEETEQYAQEAGAAHLTSWSYSAVGKAFLEGRGFRGIATERVSLLEPAKAETSALSHLEAEHAARGFRVVPLGGVQDSVEELYRVYAAASADAPQDFREDNVQLEEWRRETLEHPQLSADASFVVLAGDRPVSLAFVALDEPAAIAANRMTGTLPDFRRRGLARLAKLATIRWAAEHGISTIVTANDEINVAMVALNESLGYRPVATETHYVRDH